MPASILELYVFVLTTPACLGCVSNYLGIVTHLCHPGLRQSLVTLQPACTYDCCSEAMSALLMVLQTLALETHSLLLPTCSACGL